MNGEMLFDFYINKGGPYSQILLTAFSAIGEKLFPLLEKAEKAGKQIILVDDSEFEGCDDQPFKVQIQF